MRLKRVKIFGFKTFADKTTFDLDGDLVAVVGPNGCGKSNIVDAILWGLGEPNARQLRASNSQEIIFSGSAKRKPLGFAEVTLVFDNEDGMLGVDALEVSITRRLDRKGDSDFEINGQRCRLKDIYDLLADSGLGRSGYAIVGQKEIDAALAASAEDRRAWIDEAAGVQRYRAKRTESLRRLEQAKEHLSRIQDILSEIERQREPLRKEAETAIQYKAAVNVLREIEVGLFAKEIFEAAQTMKRLSESMATMRQSTELDEATAAALEEQIEEAGHLLADLEREMDAVRQLQQAAASARDRCEGQKELALQKIAGLDELEANILNDKDASASRLESLQKDFQDSQKEAEEWTAALEALRESVAGSGEAGQRLLKGLHEVEQRLEVAKETEQRRVQWQAEANVRKQRLKDIERELLGVLQSMPELESAFLEASRGHEEKHEAVLGQQAKVQDLRAEIKESQTAQESGAAILRKLLSQKSELEGKKRGIEATIDAHEGLSQGSRAVMMAVSRGLLEDDYQPVGEAISVDADLVTAIETALGASANDLITPNEHAAKAAIEWLKSNRLGRATFQPVTLMRANYRRHEIEQLLHQKGVVGVASELVRCDPHSRPVIDSLLGRVIIVETLDDSLRLAKTQGWSRMVTMDGEVVHASGAVSGGAAAKQGSGIIQRKAELEEIERQIAELARKIEQASHRKTDEELAELARKLESLEAQLQEAKEERDEAKSWMLNVQSELDGTRKAQAKLEKEKQDLTDGPGEVAAGESVPELEKQRDDLKTELTKQTLESEGAQEKLAEAELRSSQARQRAHELGKRLEIEGDSSSSREKRIANIARERNLAKEQITESEKGKAAAEKQLEEAAARIQACQEKKASVLQENFDLTDSLKQTRERVAASRQLMSQSEIEWAKVDAKRAAAQERLLEEYGISEEEALRTGEIVEVEEGAAQRVAQLRREIRQMGDVNLGAIEAYERLNERFDELNTQFEDVDKSREEIEAGIRELDKLTRERFRVTYEKVAAEFQETFIQMFGGGEGQITLTNPEDLLLTGVDIEVTIPGKKRQRLELLSGGERALAACAFLFALLRVKASPLVVLDEVDAPLDGRNVERFINALRQFTGKIQFVCITHNPLTIEAAPMWFGVTMQEPGVTTVVPYRSGNAPAAYVEA